MLTSQSLPSTVDIRARLDELFTLRVTLAEHDCERDAAILRLIPPDLQEIIASVMREFQDLHESRMQAEKALDTQLRDDIRRLGAAVRSTHLQASYAPGRRSWDTDRLLALAERYPEIHECLKVGEPIISIRAVAQRARTTPLLYDQHS